MRNANKDKMNTSGVSKNFIQFVENLGIPIDDKGTNCSVKDSKLKIFTSQRTRPESYENSVMTPTMSEALSSSVIALKKDYKSNAIAFRIAKKQTDAIF
mmetsp:Transcript_18065/g.17240  ORF Transcript_18065/g.17240 Transcript_18065/m.17240 type:complete len:99 (-) Transcript_18065:95-391(-)|eukprot:CAMPEP_0170555508 /NCGR_PEP_ID=MMETSP0211-20121228/13411_1 /TAXON_ID=311385 /ORGANISM="Pseudokeronopsis sp., Strain OXSARD2" /LENGTH=98 /DNA_ID=CAMNT_0010865401 /DNA_START=726 /DNA_END=1022 /DNA_ORIENTATION=+